MKKLLLGFALGVIATTIFLSVLALYEIGPERWWTKTMIFAEPFYNFDEQKDLRVALGGEHGHKIVFERGDEAFSLFPKRGYTFKDPVVRADGKAAYVIELEMMGMRAYNYSALVRFSIPDHATPLSEVKMDRFLTREILRELFGDGRAWIGSLYGVSESGNRALVLVSAADERRSTSTSTHFFWHPYWFYFDDGRIERVSY